jgi:TRAP-type uncharacterized transport system substrate-binding protein
MTTTCFRTAALAAIATLAASAAQAQVTLTAETAAAGASPYVSVTALGEIAAERGIANFQVLDDQVLTNSLQNVAEGKSDITAAPFILPFLLSKGAGPYATLGAEKGAELADKVAVLYTYRYGGMSLYSFDSSPVKGWDSVAGHKILNGPPQGAALANARAMIKIITGLDDGTGYQGIQVNWGQAVKTITDGTVDAAVLPIYLPDPRMIQSAASGKMTLYSVPKAIYEGEAMQKYLKSPGSGRFEVDLSQVTFPEGISVQSEDGMWRSPATVGGEVVRKDMDFELAKALTKAYVENLERWKTKAAIMQWVALGETDPSITGMCGANPLKYHPGAVAAWQEAGYTLPDCAMP